MRFIQDKLFIKICWSTIMVKLSGTDFISLSNSCILIVIALIVCIISVLDAPTKYIYYSTTFVEWYRTNSRNQFRLKQITREKIRNTIIKILKNKNMKKTYSWEIFCGWKKCLCLERAPYSKWKNPPVKICGTLLHELSDESCTVYSVKLVESARAQILIRSDPPAYLAFIKIQRRKKKLPSLCLVSTPNK